MKRKLLVLIAILSLVALTMAGCGKKTALTGDQFKSIMEKESYQVVDITNQYGEGIGVNKALVALKGDYQIEFYEISSEQQAKQAFAQNKSGFESLKGSNATETNVESDTSAKYTLKSDGKYMVVSRIGSTFVYLDVADSLKAEIDKVLKELGY